MKYVLVSASNADMEIHSNIYNTITEARSDMLNEFIRDVGKSAFGYDLSGYRFDTELCIPGECGIGPVSAWSRGKFNTDWQIIEVPGNETYRQKFVRKFGALFADPEVRNGFEGCGVEGMSLSDDEKTVAVEFVGGKIKEVNVAGDSLVSIVYDIIKYSGILF